MLGRWEILVEIGLNIRLSAIYQYLVMSACTALSQHRQLVPDMGDMGECLHSTISASRFKLVWQKSVNPGLSDRDGDWRLDVRHQAPITPEHATWHTHTQNCLKSKWMFSSLKHRKHDDNLQLAGKILISVWIFMALVTHVHLGPHFASLRLICVGLLVWTSSQPPDICGHRTQLPGHPPDDAETEKSLIYRMWWLSRGRPRPFICSQIIITTFRISSNTKNKILQF